MTTLNFTDNVAQQIELRTPSNIFIAGTWDSTSMVITNTDSGVAIVDPLTADDKFNTFAKKITFTPSGGGVAMDITVTIENDEIVY